MNTSLPGISFIAKNEGTRLKAYKDSAGVWTIGVGHTGKHVHKGMKITNERAIELLRIDVQHAENAVNHYVTKPVTQSQFDALVDFTFNLGAGALHGSTLLHKMNAGDFEGVGKEFKRWVHAGGKIIPGLVSRRKRDRDLFLS